jgi:D-alanyl-D-alanine carboxypeptidase/D-alanyl-D-alanine-endopeptidase (penicillin-binding protein 4)
VYFGNHLRGVLIASGINVAGAAVDIDDISDAPPRASERVLAAHRSAPLSELAQPMMRLSQNLYAETLLKALGAWAGTPSTAGGIAAARNVLDLWNIPPSALQQSDGSGLSPYNLASASALARILEHVSQDRKLRGAFVEALPAAGREGTLENRMKGTPAQGNVRAKTGSLSNARSLSGYVTTADGEPLVFSLIGNNFGVPPENIDRAIDAVVVRLARFSRK